METIYLPTHESPISEAETEAFLDALKSGNRMHQIIVDGKPAIVTAVYDGHGKVIMIARSSMEISGSIPVTDRRGGETPRDEKYYPSRYLSDPTLRRFAGIAAYKFIVAPRAVLGRKLQVSQTLASNA